MPETNTRERDAAGVQNNLITNPRPIEAHKTNKTMNTQLIRQLKYLVVIFCSITAGVMLMAFTVQETARAAQLEKLYLLQRNRADAAAAYIDLMNDETAPEARENWEQAERLCDKYDERIVNEEPNY